MTPGVRLVAFAGQQQGKELNEASAWPTTSPGSAWHALDGHRAQVWRSCVTLLGQVGQVQCISYFKVWHCSELTVPYSYNCTFKLQQRQEVLVIKQVVGLDFLFYRCMVAA